MNSDFSIAPDLPKLQMPEVDLEQKVRMLERRCQRERDARQQAESFLEAKSLELYEANQELQKVNEGLEQRILEQTQHLRTALIEVKDAQKKTEHLALHDPLTSLPNRRFLRQHLDEVFAKGRETGSSVAVLHIDLDRFKLINDTLGHAAGDHVLGVVGRILREVTGEEDFIARIGGDEFVIVTCFDKDPEHVHKLAQRIPERVAEPIDFEERQLRIGASVGFSYDKATHTAPDKLLISSDIALYEAKDVGRGNAQQFTSELEVIMNRKRELADEILVAIEREEFIPFYQPRLCVATNQLEGVEALARWQHPERGLLAPSEFLNIASDIGALAKIDDMVLKRVTADFHDWQAQGLNIPRFSVNISLGRLMEDGLLERLDQLDLPAGKVGFEVLESVFFDNPDKSMIDRINAIKERGISLEIDDFGSGHASIIGLVQLQPSALKIDGQLVQNLVENPVQRKLVKAIVEIGKSLDQLVVAEGVESEDHAEICRQIGCDVLQGFAIGLPMPRAALEQYCSESRRYVVAAA